MPMSFLTKNGKLVTKGGKFVKTDNPANCECCGPPPPDRCCAVCEEPLVGGLCPPGFEQQDGKCIKAIDYNCDPDVFAQIIADYPECQSGFQSNSGPCPPLPVQLWCCDGGAEGYFCGERVNVPGIGEMIGDAPIGICTSVKEVDDCSECGARLSENPLP